MWRGDLKVILLSKDYGIVGGWRFVLFFGGLIIGLFCLMEDIVDWNLVMEWDSVN